MDAKAPRSSALPTTTVNSSHVSTWPYLSGNGFRNSTYPTETQGGVLGSYYSTDFFSGDLDGRRIITHYNYEEVVNNTVADQIDHDSATRGFETVATPYVDNYTKMLDLNSSLGVSLSGLPDTGPGSYLLGHLYSNFEMTRSENATNDTLSAHNDVQAAPGSHRYFGMRGSSFDFGRYFEEKDEVKFGFTVSLWLRANAKSVGFPFVLADGFEDLSAQRSVIVDHLLGILRTGTGTWFEEDWNVYLGLYVHGPTKTLSLVQAHTHLPQSGPSAAEELVPGVVKQTWDLNVLGFNRLLNGLWHKVDLVFLRQTPASR